MLYSEYFEEILWLCFVQYLFFVRAHWKIFSIITAIYSGIELGHEIYFSKGEYLKLASIIAGQTLFSLNIFWNYDTCIEILSLFSWLQFLNCLIDKNNLYFRYSKDYILENVFLFYILAKKYYNLQIDILVSDISFLFLDLFYNFNTGKMSRIQYFIL